MYGAPSCPCLQVNRQSGEIGFILAQDDLVHGRIRTVDLRRGERLAQPFDRFVQQAPFVGPKRQCEPTARTEHVARELLFFRPCLAKPYPVRIALESLRHG